MLAQYQVFALEQQAAITVTLYFSTIALTSQKILPGSVLHLKTEDPNIPQVTCLVLDVESVQHTQSDMKVRLTIRKK